MIQRLFTGLCVSLFFCTTIQAVELVSWGTPESNTRFDQSSYKIDFYKLSNHFESQANKLYCAPASAVIVLNALRLRNEKKKKPKGDFLLQKKDLQFLGEYDPFYDRYTQKNIFEVKGIKSKEVVLGKPVKSKDGKDFKDFGFQLHQLNQLLKSHGLKTQLRVVDDQLKEDQIRKEISQNLKVAGDYVIANYARKALGQPGGGHVSPIAAYDQKSDSFLVLDVTPNKADWVWVNTKDLIAAMRTFDTVSNRGYILVSDP